MKTIVSTLFICALMITGCGGPEEPAPTPTPAPTCQKLKGTYATTTKITEVANDPTLCEGTEEGAVSQQPVSFDGNGNLEESGVVCITTYTNNNCDARVECVFASDYGRMNYTLALKPSADAGQFTGTLEVVGTGYFCPKVKGTITGIR